MHCLKTVIHPLYERERKVIWTCLINDKKSVCIRFGNRHDVCCAPVTTCSGVALRWVDTCRYLGIYFVSARSFKCRPFEPARSNFYKSFNAIFGKVGRVASESVIMQLLSPKCLPVHTTFPSKYFVLAEFHPLG